jgi:hypothetical protein
MSIVTFRNDTALSLVTGKTLIGKLTVWKGEKSIV